MLLGRVMAIWALKNPPTVKTPLSVRSVKRKAVEDHTSPLVELSAVAATRKRRKEAEKRGKRGEDDDSSRDSNDDDDSERNRGNVNSPPPKSKKAKESTNAALPATPDVTFLHSRTPTAPAGSPYNPSLLTGTASKLKKDQWRMTSCTLQHSLGVYYNKLPNCRKRVIGPLWW